MWLIAGAIAILPATLASWSLPLVQSAFINALAERREPDLWQTLLLFAGLAVLTSMLTRAAVFCEGRAACRIGADLKKHLTSRLLALPLPVFTRCGEHYLAGRLVADSETLQMLFSGTGVRFLADVLKLMGGLLFLTWFDWRLGAIAVLLLPLYAALLHRMIRRAYELSAASGEARARNFGDLHALTSRIGMLKAGVAEQRTRAQLDRQFDQIAAIRLRRLTWHYGFHSVLTMLPWICRGGLLIWSIFLLLRGEWTLGRIWAAQCYAGYVFTPQRQLLSSWEEFQNVRAALARIMRFCSLSLEEEAGEAGLAPQRLSGKVEFRKVVFSHLPEVPVLRNVSFTVHPGEKILLTGSSGSGKTTLLALIDRLLLPESGEILFDDRPAEQYRTGALRQRIGYLDQHPELYGKTLAENLQPSYGPPYPDAQLLEALCEAGGEDILRKLPGGLHAPLPNDGKNFSAGEKLRIAAAREILRDTDIVLLDEPTAALDADHEEILLAIFHSRLRHRTLFLVSHHPETLPFPVRVFHLAGGELTEAPA